MASPRCDVCGTTVSASAVLGCFTDQVQMQAQRKAAEGQRPSGLHAHVFIIMQAKAPLIQLEFIRDKVACLCLSCPHWY